MPKINELIGKQQLRDLDFSEFSKIDAKARTVEVCFSSELTVSRWFGDETLSHEKESVDLTRLLSGAPVLVGHDADDQVGVVESARVDPDKKGRAVLRFGRSQRAQDILNDVVDGIRQKISVGYLVDEYQETDTGYVATRWQPLEISIVSIPADDTVGVGRKLETKNTEDKIMTEEIKKPDVNIKDIEQKAQRNAIEAERKRVSSIQDFAVRHNLQEMGNQYVSDGRSIVEFRDAAFAELEKRYAVDAEKPETHIDMTPKEIVQYSLMRAVNAMSTGNWKGAEFEREASNAIEDKLGKQSRGFFVPWEVQSRAQNTQTMTAGGALVGVEHMGGSFIDMLRASSIVTSLGARVITGLVGNCEIPKQTGASTAYWVGEGGDITDSEATFGTIALAPRTLGIAVPITRRLMLQSDPSIDSLIMSDIAIQMALAVDDAVLEGDGFNKPLGITGVTGVATSTIASAGVPTWAELVEFETDIDASNALTGNLAYVTTPAVRGNLKITAKDSGSGLFLLDGGSANGYPVATTSQLTANRIIFGNFADVVIGNWGVLDIGMEDSTLAASGGKVIRAFQDMDSVVRHAESFCINA